MQNRDSLEEKLIFMIEDLTDQIEVYESFFRLNDPHAEYVDKARWKEMLEEHKFMKSLRLSLQDHLLRLECML
jgi:hypothetical protein